MPVLNQRQRVEFFPWQAVNQQNAPLNQRKIAEVGSGKPSNGAGWRAVNQLNQLNQHYFCLLSEKKQRLAEREVSMSAQNSAYGRLVADPETRTTGKGTSMAMARLAVSLPCNAAADGQATFWLGVIAFGKQADALAKHQKGDLVSVVGNMQINQWTGQDGGTQQGYQVLADSVISARTARPGGRQGQQGQATDALRRAQQQPAPPGYEDYDQTPPFDDSIPL